MTLEQISQKIKSARENQGLTIGQIYDRTKIPPNHLAAIEEAHYDDLPEPIYVAGFIKRYADCLGLNGQTLAEEYRQCAEAAKNNGNGHHGIFGSKPVAVQPAPSPTYLKAAKPERHDQAPSLTKTIFYPAFLIVFIIGLIVWLNQWQQSNSNRQDPSVDALRASTQRFNAVPATNTVPTTTTTTAPAQPTTGDSAISVLASQHVWVNVKSVASGENLYNGFLEAGDRRDFTDTSGLRVRAGNAGSLTVEFQGKKETLGPAGKPMEKTFSVKTAAELQADTAAAAATASTAVTPVRTVTPRKVTKRISDGAASQSATRRSDSFVRSSIPGQNRSADSAYRYNGGRQDSE